MFSESHSRLLAVFRLVLFYSTVSFRDRCRPPRKYIQEAFFVDMLGGGGRRGEGGGDRNDAAFQLYVQRIFLCRYLKGEQGERGGGAMATLNSMYRRRDLVEIVFVEGGEDPPPLPTPRKYAI